LDRVVAVFASFLIKIAVAAFVSFPIRDLPNVKCKRALEILNEIMEHMYSLEEKFDVKPSNAITVGLP
jgi:hypothetical protein